LAVIFWDVVARSTLVQYGEPIGSACTVFTTGVVAFADTADIL
jgi:hypothetical protein